MTDVELKAQQDALTKTVVEGVQPIKDELKAVNDRLEKIEKAPAILPSGRASVEVYKGYRMSKMFGKQRDLWMKDAEGGLRTEEAQDKLAKSLIDMVRAKRFGDAEAHARLMVEREEIIKTNALNDATAGEGGYLIQPEYQWDIIKLARNTSYALQLCRVVNMVNLVQYFPKEASLGTVSWATEGAQVTPNEPTFDQLQLTAKKAMTLARVTNEQLADNMVDLPGLLAEQFAYAIGQELDNQVFNGTGTPWSGLLALVTQSVTLSAGASFSTLTFTDLSSAISKILEARLNGAVWVVSRNAKHYIRSLKDTYGRPIYAMPGNGVPGTVFEYPLFQSEKMPNTDGASAKMAIFGNFNYALLGRRQGLMTVDIDPYGMFDYDTTRFRTVTRWGFGVGDVNAFALVKAAAA